MRPLVLQAAGEATDFVERYVDWAAGVDDFEPLRVEFDYDAPIPDPSGDGDLAAPDGRGVHYQGRAHALVVDDDRAHWLLVHRFGPWTPAEVLRLDQAGRDRGVGVGGDVPRRPHRRRPLQRAHRRRSLPAHPAAPGAWCHRAGRSTSWRTRRPRWWRRTSPIYPTPGPDCASCPFLAPCLAMQDGHDVRGPAAPRLPARDRRGASRRDASAVPPGRWAAARCPASGADDASAASRCGHDGRLAEADPGVVGRHHPVDEHLEAGGRQPLLHDLAQPHVLEHAAGEGHRRRARARTPPRWRPRSPPGRSTRGTPPPRPPVPCRAPDRATSAATSGRGSMTTTPPSSRPTSTGYDGASARGTERASASSSMAACAS